MLIWHCSRRRLEYSTHLSLFQISMDQSENFLFFIVFRSELQQIGNNFRIRKGEILLLSLDRIRKCMEPKLSDTVFRYRCHSRMTI